MNLSPDQLHTLRHMLGINTPNDRLPKPHRDYAAVCPGDPQFAELERLGAVECYRRPCPGFEYDYFRCTPAGRAAAMASHKTIRRTKSQRIYSKFLDVSDALQDLTFREFLTLPEFAECRRSA
jgi:hypothetical protein